MTRLAIGLVLAVMCQGQDFERDVRPVLNVHCAECHSAKVKTSGFSVDSVAAVIGGGNKHGAAVMAGHPESSPMLRMIKGEMAPRMPLGKSLAGGDIAKIEAWIRAMLPAPASTARGVDWRWAFERPVKPEPPSKRANPIDAFIAAKLESNGLKPAPAASKAVLARRVSFDLIGMPPSAEELTAFVDDASPDAYAKYIDRLLDNPRYGERWGRHWLDLARYGETSGLEGDGAIGNAWRYRDWVIQAFNSDMPYDRFVTLQIAGGDEHSQTRNNYQPDVQGIVPTGFLRLAPWDRSNLVAEEVRQNYLNEVTTATSSIFLGLTAGCARCHDHKYDPIPTKDFYRLQAFFNATSPVDVDVPYKDEEFAADAKKKIAEYEERLKGGPERVALDALEKDLLARLQTRKAEESRGRELSVADLRLEMRRKQGSVFSTEERERHADLLEDSDRTGDLEQKTALDAFETERLKRLTRDEARYREVTVADLRGELNKKYEKVLFSEDDKTKHRELTSRIRLYERRIARLKPRALSVTNVPGPPSGPMIAPTRVLKSGDYRMPGEAVEPGFLSAITGHSNAAALETDRYRQYPTRGLRTTLAKWIASPDNPLTARVMVNRIWQQHFGLGIVATPSDFGKNGARPTHPELLDWLAHRFVEEKWSIKAMHRLILTSDTYRQASENPDVKDPAADPANSLLWKFNRRRLEAEEIRDSMLHVSGRLNSRRGGPSVFPPLPADLADAARYGRTGDDMWEPNESEDDNRRRSIYTFQRRSLPQPMMLAFDSPVFSESCEVRSVTTTPLQALSMMNGDLVNQEATHLAERIIRQAGDDPRARIRALFATVLNREPRADELAKFAAFSGPFTALCRVLLNSNEFLYVD